MLYLITDRQAFRRNPEINNDSAARLQLEAIGKASQAGCQLIQIRERDMSARALMKFTREAIAYARPWGARVLVNDRLDIAMAAGADGVHLRASSIPAGEIRAGLMKKGLGNFLIGVSTHSLAEAKSAEEGGANFIVYGPIYDTPSKRAFGRPMGLELFAEVSGALKIPTLALGGINLLNFHEPLRHGAAGIAAIGLFTDLDRLEQNIQTILRES